MNLMFSNDNAKLSGMNMMRYRDTGTDAAILAEYVATYHMLMAANVADTTLRQVPISDSTSICNVMRITIIICSMKNADYQQQRNL